MLDPNRPILERSEKPGRARTRIFNKEDSRLQRGQSQQTPEETDRELTRLSKSVNKYTLYIYTPDLLYFFKILKHTSLPG